MERNDKKNEMEQIQNSLEEFLRQEVEGYEKPKGKPNAAPKKEVDVLINRQAPRPTNHSQSQGSRTSSPREDRTSQPQRKSVGAAERKGSKEQPRRRAYEEAENSSSVKEPNKKTKKKNEKIEKKGNRQAGNKPKSKIKKIMISVAALAILLLGAWFLLVGSMYDKMQYNESENIAKGPLKEKGVTNILLIGSDSRTEGDEGRSDAMILLSISNKTKTIHMTSLLRDMYVEIPGYKGNRLNAAYSYGGPELLIETIKLNLGVEVSRYVVVNFQAFANLVDAVGGVNLELSNEEVQWVNAYLNEYNLLQGNPIDTNYLDTSLSGMIHLNGPQSLAYSRNRYIGTDFGRTERQRKVLSQVIKQLPKGVITNPGELINGLFPNLTTNMTKSECFSLSFQGSKLLTYEIVQGSIPQEGTYKNANIRGMEVLEVDFEKNKQYIQTAIYGEQ